MIPLRLVHLLPVALALTCSCARAFELKVADNEHVDVMREGIVLARFMTAHDTSTPERHTDTYKPYLHVFDPSGAVRLTKGPGGQFPHHRGIFVGYNKIAFEGKSYDRWHMKGGDQITRKILPPTTSGDKAELNAEIEWQGEAGAPLLTEERRLTFTAPQKPFYLGIELKTSIKPAKGEAVLDGDPEHAGAQFRPSEKIDPSKTTYIFPGENVDAHKVRDLPWAAEIFTVEGRIFTVIVLNHPSNPKGAAFSAYRDYGRFGVFPKGVAKPDAPFRLHFQWLIAQGEVRDAATLQKAWNTFAGEEAPVPALTIRPAEGKKPAPAPKSSSSK